MIRYKTILLSKKLLSNYKNYIGTEDSFNNLNGLTHSYIFIYIFAVSMPIKIPLF